MATIKLISMSELQEHLINCPYCGEMITVFIECLDEQQHYIEDCQVCCCPIEFTVEVGFDGLSQVMVKTGNE